VKGRASTIEKLTAVILKGSALGDFAGICPMLERSPEKNRLVKN